MYLTEQERIKCVDLMKSLDKLPWTGQPTPEWHSPALGWFCPFPPEWPRTCWSGTGTGHESASWSICWGKKKKKSAMENTGLKTAVNKNTAIIIISAHQLSSLSKRPKLAWCGHVTCHNSLSKTILQGTLEGGQCRGQQMKCWMDNIKAWTSLPVTELLTMASCRKDWKKIFAASSLDHVPSTTKSVKGLNWPDLN